MRKKCLTAVMAALMIVGSVGLTHANTLTLVSDASTLFSASGTDDLGAMDAAVQSGTYPTPNLPVIVATQGTGILQIPGTSIVNSNPSSYYVGISGYYQTSFVLPANFSNASLDLQAVGDDGGYVYLNGHNLGEFYWNSKAAYSFFTSDQDLFLAGTNLLTFVVNNSGRGPTGLSYDAVVNYQATPVPLPPALLLLGLGLVGLAAARRKFKR